MAAGEQLTSGQTTDRLGRAKAAFSGMSASRKISILGVIAVAISSLVVALMWANRVDYEPLYTGLSQGDAGAITAKLKERRTPFKLDGNGTIVLVPSDQVQETRLVLATEGLPAGGAVGMELFNENKLGTTDFVQRLNYQRALQGELERTIKKFPEVDQVRVHLNIPKQSLFVEDAREPSASVVLNLKGKAGLSRSQLSGIVLLVSNSVEGLKADKVSIVDTSGGLLYSKSEADGASLSDSQIDQRRVLEQTLAQRITTMLERVVGPDRAMARVNADLNFQQISTNEEVFDPDRTAIRSEQRQTERSQGSSAAAGGPPTPTYELGTGNRQQTGGGQNSAFEKSDETTNYEVTKITRQILTAAGDLKKLSVAVMVDGTYTETEKDGKTVKTFVPRSKEDLAQLETLVKNAVGFDEKRGDSVVVASVPFLVDEIPAESGWKSQARDYYHEFSRPALNVGLIVLFFLFVVRPLMAWLKREASRIPAQPAFEHAALSTTADDTSETRPALEPSQGPASQLPREQMLMLAKQNPERTLNLIRSWIDER